MIFADEPTTNAVYVSAISAIVTIALAAISVWREIVAARTRAESARELAEVKTAMIVAGRSTAGRLDEVKTALAENTAITTAAASVVSGGRDRQADFEQHVDALRQLMTEHGIECPPHPAKKEG